MLRVVSDDDVRAEMRVGLDESVLEGARRMLAAALEVEVGVMGAPNPHRIGRFEVRVVLPGGVPERYRDQVMRVAETCTVHHTLTHRPEIAVILEEGAAVA
jgi:uncharacterized OsmC-like protein